MPLTRFRSNFSVRRSQLSREGTRAQFAAVTVILVRRVIRPQLAPHLSRNCVSWYWKVEARRRPRGTWQRPGGVHWNVSDSLTFLIFLSFPPQSSETTAKSWSGRAVRTGVDRQHWPSKPPAFLVALKATRQNLTPTMERVQHMTKSAIRRASQIEVNPQAKRNLQELFVNFTLILICLLLIYIIVLLSSWGDGDRLTDGVCVCVQVACVHRD